uniref:thioredoxin domain-containing protein n=1 Tax=Mesorhizobium sp. 1M-11 TaxID=1529006 RepID=UPI000A8950C1
QPLAALRVDSPASFDAAVAANSGKPILVSFGADWCTVCKSNEAIMNRPEIRRRLDAMPVIDVDVTGQDAGAQALMTRFSVVGPPTLFLLDTEGREIRGSRIIGPITADEISGRLSRAGA